MSVIARLATSLNRSDEVPNQILAKEIVGAEDRAAVQELVDHLTVKDKNIQADCIKVLYEIGYLKPALIADHVRSFLALLRSKNNRLVWGGMTALGAIAALKPDEIWSEIDLVIRQTEIGSAITQDWGVRVLAATAVANEAYTARIFPFLLTFLEKCPPKDLPRHAESALLAVNTSNREGFLRILEAQKTNLKPTQSKRIEKVIRQVKAL